MHKDTDSKIITLLEENAALTNREIGEKLKLPTTTVHNRIKKLEENGVIKKYKAVLDKAKIGKPISAVIQINVDFSGHNNKEKLSQAELCRKIRKIHGTETVLIVTGDFDLLVQASVATKEELSRLVAEIRKLDGITKTVTSLVLEEID
jgi:Lrp/AsnC family leucine-responsive transcriptional regulator